MTRRDADGRLFYGSIAVSAVVHSLLFMPWPVLHSHAEPPELMELDLAGPPGPEKAPGRPEAAPATKTAAQWTVPDGAPSTSVPAPAAPDPGDADAPSEGPAGVSSGGSGTVRPPVLLNHGELHRLLQSLYPDAERELGREGMVVLSLSVGVDGRVNGAEVKSSAGPAFDAAALRVAEQLRYAPAEDRGRPLAVRLRQAVLFKLDR